MSRGRFLTWSVLILLVGFALRVISLADDSLWSDEAFTMFFASAPAEDFVNLLLADGVHVPLYFLLMRALPLNNDLLLRWPSVLLGLGGIALLIGVTRRLYHDPRLALWAGALLACNPYHIWFSRMARPYALFFAIALLASAYFLLLLRGERSTAHWIGFALSSTAALLTHFFAAALPLAQYAVFAFALRTSRRMLRRWLVVQIAAFVPLAWWLYRLGTQEVISFGIAWIPTPSALDPLITLGNLGIGFDGSTRLALVPALMALAAGLILGVRRAWQPRRRDRADLYWMLLLLVALVPITLISQVRAIYADRYFMVILPALLLLVLRGWDALRPSARHAPITTLLASIVIVTGAVSVLDSLARGTNERQSWHSAADTIAADFRPDDVIVGEPALVLLPLLRYWDDDVALRAALIPPEDAADSPAPRLWVVYPNPQVNVHREGVVGAFDPFAVRSTPIAAWLSAHRADVTTRRDLNGITVLLVVPTP